MGSTVVRSLAVIAAMLVGPGVGPTAMSVADADEPVDSTASTHGHGGNGDASPAQQSSLRLRISPPPASRSGVVPLRLRLNNDRRDRARVDLSFVSHGDVVPQRKHTDVVVGGAGWAGVRVPVAVPRGGQAGSLTVVASGRSGGGPVDAVETIWLQRDRTGRVRSSARSGVVLGLRLADSAGFGGRLAGGSMAGLARRPAGQAAVNVTAGADSGETTVTGTVIYLDRDRVEHPARFIEVDLNWCCDVSALPQTVTTDADGHYSFSARFRFRGCDGRRAGARAARVAAFLAGLDGRLVSASGCASRRRVALVTVRVGVVGRSADLPYWFTDRGLAVTDSDGLWRRAGR